MIESRKYSEGIEKSPFQEDVDIENYFAGANRSEILSQMIEAVQNKVAFMTLTGEEGSGKTMMCRLLEHAVAPSCCTVFFSQAVDSFEDVVRIIAMRLGLDEAIAMDDRNIDQTLGLIADLLLHESVNLLVIFDEAENIYLAALEKTLKMLDRMIASGVRMHVLFSGRQTFLENCDQLSIDDFRDMDELHLELTLLTESETADYLRNCAARLTELDAAKVFPDKAVQNIFSLAKGNFRMTNILGEEAVKTYGDDTSFMVLLENVKEGGGPAEAHPETRKVPNLMMRAFDYFPWIGGVLCCVLLLFYLFRPGDDGRDGGQDLDRIAKTETAATGQQVGDRSPERMVPVALEQAEEGSPPEEMETAGPEQQKNVPEVENPAQQPEEQLSSQIREQGQREVEPRAAGMAAQVRSETAIDDAAAKVATEVEEMQAPHKAVAGEVANILKLRPGKELKKRIGAPSKAPQEIIRVQSSKKVQKNIVLNARPTNDRLYDERVSAGRGWQRSDKQNMYTVQLMVLASKSAEKNLKKMLSQVEYRQEAGNFYIFKKVTVPAAIYVFYGEYPSIKTARLAENSLPQFLRDRKPYALSIKGAVAKVNK